MRECQRLARVYDGAPRSQGRFGTLVTRVPIARALPSSNRARAAEARGARVPTEGVDHAHARLPHPRAAGDRRRRSASSSLAQPALVRRRPAAAGGRRRDRRHPRPAQRLRRRRPALGLRAPAAIDRLARRSTTRASDDRRDGRRRRARRAALPRSRASRRSAATCCATARSPRCGVVAWKLVDSPGPNDAMELRNGALAAAGCARSCSSPARLSVANAPRRAARSRRARTRRRRRRRPSSSAASQR